MKSISFQVIDGVDKGRTFLDLELPVTIGREEGNAVRLNDDRVSRFHAKIQEDHDELVLTDLDSTNGTRVNGEPIQLRLLRVGDRINVGRSTLVFGTLEEIAEEARRLDVDVGRQTVASDEGTGGQTDLQPSEFGAGASGEVEVFDHPPPSLPRRLSPAQAAQLSELIDFLHRALANATATVHMPLGSEEAKLTFSGWQQIQAIQSVLAQYSRAIAEPGAEDPPGEG